jgi:hypothetical protein
MSGMSGSTIKFPSLHPYATNPRPGSHHGHANHTVSATGGIHQHGIGIGIGIGGVVGHGLVHEARRKHPAVSSLLGSFSSVQ